MSTRTLTHAHPHTYTTHIHIPKNHTAAHSYTLASHISKYSGSISSHIPNTYKAFQSSTMSMGPWVPIHTRTFLHILSLLFLHIKSSYS